MLCIFKTPLEPTGTIGGDGLAKVRAKRPAGDVQLGVEAAIGKCHHGPDIQFRKEGAKRLTLATAIVVKRRADGSKVNDTEAASAKAQPKPFFDALYTEEAVTTVTGEIADAALNRVKVSPSLVKPNGSPVTLADFPENFAFGNGTTVGVKVRLKDSAEPVALSWCLLEGPVADAVLADAGRYEALRQLMEE